MTLCLCCTTQASEDTELEMKLFGKELIPRSFEGALQLLLWGKLRLLRMYSHVN